MSKQRVVKVGARNSKLAVAQTNKALARIEALLPVISFERHWLTTTGDRDQKQDLQTSAPNFFTDDLDQKLISGELDCAVHSAKDLPDVIDSKLDWLWLPWREDPRDAIILNDKFEMYKGNIVLKGSKAEENYPGLKLGISSDRRESYCAERFPTGELLSIRGNIDGRIAQLDEGKFDMIIMAVAGLNRLDLDYRINEYIPLKDLKSPEGQGYLAVTYRKGDPLFDEIRKLFTKPVIFAGSGPGAADLAPVATVNALKECDICLYDALSPVELLDHLSENAQAVYVGKRSGLHSRDQNEICELILEYAKQGKAVVRLKGGDPGIFGRLAEEIDVMDENKLSYKVIPATSSLSAATTGTGMLLTRRGLSRGFRVITPCREKSTDYHVLNKEEREKMPLVFFMGITKVKRIVSDLLEEGFSEDLPCSLVFSAGTSQQSIITARLSEAPQFALDKHPGHGPGLFIVGETTKADYLYKNHGTLAGQTVLVTGSETIQKKSEKIIAANGGVYQGLPTIALNADDNAAEVLKTMNEFDWLVITSPAAVTIFLDMIERFSIDMRSIPKVMTCGPGTSEPFKQRGIFPDAEAPNSFGVKGILETAKEYFEPGQSVLRLASNLAGTDLGDAMTELGVEVVNTVLYTNTPLEYDSCPEFSAVFFASASAVRSFVAQFGTDILADKTVVAIGEPTAKELTQNNYAAKIVADESTVEGSFNALMANLLNLKLAEL